MYGNEYSFWNLEPINFRNFYDSGYKHRKAKTNENISNFWIKTLKSFLSNKKYI